MGRAPYSYREQKEAKRGGEQPMALLWPVESVRLVDGTRG